MKRVFCLLDQAHPVQDAGVLCPGGNEVNAGGLDGTMTQHVGQPDNVPARPVKQGGEQVPQVVGEHLSGLHSRLLAQPLHLRPLYLVL